MPTLDELRQRGEPRRLTRKAQKTYGVLAPLSVDLPESLYGEDGSLLDFPTLGWLPIGRVSTDGYSYNREVSREPVTSMGYFSPDRSDVTEVTRQVTFTGHAAITRHMLELQYGVDLSGVELRDLPNHPAIAEVVFDEPEVPVDSEWRLLLIASDGPVANNWVMGKGFGTVQHSEGGGFTWGQEGPVVSELTLDVLTDDAIGTPVRHYLGGTGPKQYRDLLYFGASENGGGSGGGGGEDA